MIEFRAKRLHTGYYAIYSGEYSNIEFSNFPNRRYICEKPLHSFFEFPWATIEIYFVFSKRNNKWSYELRKGAKYKYGGTWRYLPTLLPPTRRLLENCIVSGYNYVRLEY